MPYEDILYEVRGDTAWVTLNRPEKLNAVRWQSGQEMHEALGEAETPALGKALGDVEALAAGATVDAAEGVADVTAAGVVAGVTRSVTFDFRTPGRLIADWFVADSGGKGNAIVYTSNDNPSAVEVRVGPGVAVLTGDFLLARAMRLLTTYGDIRIIRAVSEITIEMSEGEVMEILATGDAKIAAEDYFEILRKKTAVFVEGCCRCGAILAGASAAQEVACAGGAVR